MCQLEELVRAFYERAGARVICEEGSYLTPRYNDRNKEWEGELMGFEFDDPIASEELKGVIEQVYMLSYQLPLTHPMVLKVIDSFRPCFISDDDQVVEDEPGKSETNTEADPAPEETKEENM